jgi:hypothetical protein
MDDATANNILEDVTTAKRLMKETPGLDQDEALMEARRMTDVKQLARAVPRKKSRWIGNNAEEAVAAVQGMVAAGGSHEEILTALAGKGWSGEEIQTIMNAAGIPAEAPRTAKPTAAAKPQNQAAKTVVKTGTEKGTGRKVVQYSDGTTAYAD